MLTSRGPSALCPAGTGAGAQLQIAPYGAHHLLSGSSLDSGLLCSKIPPGCSSGTMPAGLGAAEEFSVPANGVHAPLMPFPASRATPLALRGLRQNPPALSTGHEHPCLPSAEQGAVLALLPFPCRLGKPLWPLHKDSSVVANNTMLLPSNVNLSLMRRYPGAV